MNAPLRHCFVIALLGVLAACAGVPAVARAKSGCELFVLGIAQDGGLPHFGCERPCCVEARRSGRVLYPASLGVCDRDAGKLLLIEATPRVEEQVARLHRLAGIRGRGRDPIDALLVTHAHIGHYLGLAWFGREVASTRRVPVFCSPRFAAFLRQHGPWRQLVELDQIAPQPFEPGVAFSPWPGLSVTAVPVPHRDEFSDTMAYRLTGRERTVLFVPDVDAWEREPGLLARLLDGVDVAYLDGTFYDGSELPDRNLAEIRHPLMTRTMALLAEVARARPGALRFVHLNHTNPALHDAALRRDIEARGFRIAEPGESIRL
ncbi:MAG: MBL fold metallo-hydrolase [Planctomycetes bacterium]|nr:MBL fold metallo-hydrolase [Planctomycetota bacterium]